MDKIKVLTLLLTTLICVSISGAETKFETQDREILTTTTTDNKIITLSVPRRSISPSQVAILANLQDVQSVNTASYYAQIRKIPVENIIYLNFTPARKFIRAAEFNTLKKQVEDTVAKLSDIQAYAITWTEPWAVYHDKMNRGMGITSAFALGFEGKYYNDLSNYTCNSTLTTAMYNSISNRPFADFGIRPAMMLAGKDFSYVKELIDRGKKSDTTFPAGRGYFLRTTDNTRSLPRYSRFISTVDFWNRTDGIAMSYIDNSQNKASNYLLNKSDVFLYFTGLANVPQLTTNQYVPGGAGDHLTSYGGMLTDSKGQTSSLRFLEAGMTGSYGTMEEPCAYGTKFPDTFLFTRHYFMGASLLQSYWSSVEWPGEGVFIGDPLARPFGTQLTIDATGQLNIKTSSLRTKRIYSLMAADNPGGPFTTVLSGITLNDAPGIKTIQTPASKNYYVLKEDFDPTLPLALTDDGLGKAYPVINGTYVAWYQYVSLYPADKIFLKVYNQQSGATQTLAGPLSVIPNGAAWEGKNFVYKDLVNGKNVLQILDTAMGSIKTVQSSADGNINYIRINNNRVFWTENDGIYMYDLNKNSGSIITSDIADFGFGVDGDIIAWTSAMDPTRAVKILNISTGAQEHIDQTASFLRYQFVVRGTKVFWLDADYILGQNHIMSYDTLSRKVENFRDIKGYYNHLFDANADWIVWAEQKAEESKVNFYAYNNLLGTAQKIQTAPEDQPVTLTNRGVISFDLSGDQLAWINSSTVDYQSDVYLKNLYAIDHAAYLKLDESSGTIATDSANSNPAVLVNQPVWISGKVGGALSFDGIKSYLKIENSGTLALGKDGADFSLAFWINVRQTQSPRKSTIFYKGNGLTNEYTPSMFLSPGTNHIQFCASSTVSARTCGQSSETLPVNKWVHVAYVKEGSSLKLYLNGKPDSSLALTGTVIANKGPLYFGTDPGRAGTNCAMDDIRILNRALTAGELESLAGVNGGVAPYITASPSPVNMLPLGQTVTLSVKANGTGTLKYQWKRNGVNIPGANAGSYTIPPVKMSDSGSVYNVVITNSAGSVTSNPAIIIVSKVRRVPPPQPVPYSRFEIR